MPSRLHQAPGTYELVPITVVRAPLRGLSCPYSSRAVVRPKCAPPQVHGYPRPFESIERRPKGRAEAADSWHYRDVLMTDYWTPPTSPSQHARQRILAVIVAFVLAAILA
jgi:hypothetical protein